MTPRAEPPERPEPCAWGSAWKAELNSSLLQRKKRPWRAEGGETAALLVTMRKELKASPPFILPLLLTRATGAQIKAWVRDGAAHRQTHRQA